MRISASIWQVYLCFRLQSVNDYTSPLQDATTDELLLLACRLKIIKSSAATTT